MPTVFTHKLRVLFVSGEFPPETGFGGIGTYTKHMAESLAAAGHHATVLCRSSGVEEYTSIVNDVTIIRIPPEPHPLPRSKYTYMLRRLANRFFPHTLNRLSWALAVRKKISELLRLTARFDIIEAPECGAEGLFVSRRMCRCRIIRMHTPWEMIRTLDLLKEPWGDRFALPWFEKFTSSKAEGCSAPSEAVAEEINKRWHLENIAVIRNPLPASTYRQSTGDGWIYTGRIERRKGVHLLIQAYGSCSRYSNLPGLTLIGGAYGTDSGGTDYGEYIRMLIASQPSGIPVHWIEHSTLDEVAGHLRHSGVAFFPSLWENFPYTCLEAMASGCVVVASRCGGFPEIITDGKNGLLVEPDSRESLEKTMMMLVNHPEYRWVLGVAAREYVNTTVSPEVIGPEMVRFYRKQMGQ